MTLPAQLPLFQHTHQVDTGSFIYCPNPTRPSNIFYMDARTNSAGTSSSTSETSAGRSTPTRAPQACVSCRRQKRGCDKALPSCKLCARMARVCDYSDTPPSASSAEVAVLTQKIHELERQLRERERASAGSRSVPSRTLSSVQLEPHRILPPSSSRRSQELGNSPSLEFLDARLFRTLDPRASSPFEASAHVMSFIGDTQTINYTTSVYFDTIHPWLPILSKDRILEDLQKWPRPADTAVLLLAMRLATQGPSHHSSASDDQLYALTKQYSNSLQATSVLSLSLLNALVLVALFEHGHGIYPSAWMTVGQCVQLTDMLDITSSNYGPRLATQPTEWSDVEDQHTTWWAVYVLERVIGIGSQKRLLCPEPAATDILPNRDPAWKHHGMNSPVAKPVSNPYAQPQPPFARLCQAAIITGQVIRHVQEAEKRKVTGQRFNCAEVSQLTSMAQNLCACLPADFSAEPAAYMGLVSGRSLAFSAVMTLLRTYSLIGTAPNVNSMLDPGRTEEELSLQINSVDGLKKTAAHVADLTNILLVYSTRNQELNRISPFVLDAIYQSASALAWLDTDGKQIGQFGLEVNAQSLLRIGGRWRLGLELMKCLEHQSPGITGLAHTLCEGMEASLSNISLSDVSM